jgi:MFS family permease
MSARAESVFSNRSFSLFYAGQTFSYIGDGLRLVAIPLLVYHLIGSAVSIGLSYALELAPFALFGLIGGSLADRLDRRKLMLACDFVRFATLALFALGFALGFLTLPLLYAGIATISVCAAFFVGAQSSSLPYLLGKDGATRAIAALLTAEQSTQMVLPPVGGALFTLLGPLPALALNALTYLISQGSLAAVDTFGPDVSSGFPSPKALASDIATGFRFLWRDAAMRTVSCVSLCFNFFGFMTAASFIPFLKRDFAAGDAVVGCALGAGAIGAVAGSFLAGRVPREWGFGQVLSVAYVLDGLAFVPVMVTHDLVVAVVFLSLANGCVLFEIAQIVGWRLRVTPGAMVGRVSAAARLVALAAAVPGALAGGALADDFGARSAIVVSGVGYLAVALLLACIPAIRRESR